MAKLSKKRIERRTQLTEATKILGDVEAELVTIEKKTKSCVYLSDHLTGFYDEINKLAKGRALVEATNLVVEQVNDIIRDAKQIVQNDLYLDRVTVFVPAGNNPVYPDVLVVARTVRQSLERARIEFKRQRGIIDGLLTKTNTVVAALQCFLSGEENCELGLKEDIDRYFDGQLDSSCFYENENAGGEDCFDFDRLDSESVERFIRGPKIDDADTEKVEPKPFDADDLDLDLDLDEDQE